MCDTVLIDSYKAGRELRQGGSVVAQVRIVFEPVPAKGCILPEHLRTPLVYIQDFMFADSDKNERPCKISDILMYRLQRRCYRDSHGVIQRAGEVIPLLNVVRPVDIAPVYGGPVMGHELNEFNALEIPMYFWLNNMWDSDTYEALTVEGM
ncbi:hypothetical protein DAEQUDRAFT_728366 [Daedalea quercina L-15889]|uniref:Uncharacterized protein n=1 Tax=Daedalea quercina L-15889 TaxID=1314783 RepID=A0A165PE19_9APHY|nr:hypothetical protein DAEQUDRAFT_728366 [Daedalea quercina L-15889]